MELVIYLKVSAYEIDSLRYGTIGIFEFETVGGEIDNFNHPTVDERYPDACEIDNKGEGGRYILLNSFKCFVTTA